MADLSKKWADNIEGLYFVDQQCIDCDACRTEAPLNFTRNNDQGYSFVFKQPSTQEENEQCLAAMEACPVEAIGQNSQSQA
jgi:ferredoxin